MRALLFFAIGVTVLAADGKIQFNRDVRPILAENCFNCRLSVRTERSTAFLKNTILRH